LGSRFEIMDNLVIKQNIEDRIFTIRDKQVMIDRDLAFLYKVETKVLNQAVKRNIQRFPSEFRFQLKENEKNELVTICDRFESLKYSSSLPYVFTEQGVSMLSAVLKSDTAIQTSIDIINSFVKMRSFLKVNADIFKRLDNIEKRQIGFEITTNEKFEKVFNALEDKTITATEGVFFDGEIFDAYSFFSSLIKKAKKTIILLDNYCDETTLIHLSKASSNINIFILTKNISKQFQLDIDRYNAQYGNLKVVKFVSSHDRFLILDQTQIYHIGASLKDLGKKWFAFSLLQQDSFALMEKITNIINKKQINEYRK